MTERPPPNLIYCTLKIDEKSAVVVQLTEESDPSVC
jgi:hypothetical protein